MCIYTYIYCVCFSFSVWFAPHILTWILSFTSVYVQISGWTLDIILDMVYMYFSNIHIYIYTYIIKSARTEGAGAWSSGWHSKKVTGLPGGGPIFRPKPPVFDRSWRSPSKNTVKNSTEDTCSWTRPSKIGKRKVKKTRVFQLFDLNFLVCNIFFCGSAGGRARRRIFEFLDPFPDWFSSFCDSRNTGFYSVFLFSACLTASFKTSKNLVNYAVLCYGVNENIVNTSVFWRWLKKHCKLQCFWPPDPQKPWYLQWFLLLTAQKHCK